ncbi:MAG: NifU-like protein involved in Fe-S cluster formation [Paracoccaceae bacterium]|jgi:NifU-like protein involved in Fe-S cluster formation
MGENQDLIKLYSQRILALAASIPLMDRLEAPDATVRKRSPLCGSTVTVDVMIKDGVVAAFGQDVKACALGQAAASIVATNITGQSYAQILQARDELRAMLKEDGPEPSSPFDELKVLLPAREYKNRHASILLALDATVEAFEEAQNKAYP